MNSLLSTLLFAGAASIIGWLGAALVIIVIFIIFTNTESDEEISDDDGEFN